MKEKLVTHPGIVSKVEKGRAEVTVVTHSACASCEIKGVCSISETKEKTIEVDLKPGESYREGQQVTVEMKESLGHWAVLIGYFFPFLVVLGGLILFISIGMDQGMAGLLSLLALAVYYLVLYLLRGALRTRFSQRISA